ncbi:MAG: 4-(cytidine 5'-diphospho)-2-C-methyl-D-erythritol kinase [Halanaerobiales bacterium]|nr:4-(cytidine 5'-diphospho)-2-C-methyl-D-erythritol kinase [Halanaerobiales bacterium]
MNQLTVKAYAKINLFLDIKNLREDGYHNLEMVMQSISLHDTITLYKKDNGIKIETNHSKLTNGEENLAYKAAQAVINRTKLAQGIKIFIDKKIPIAAGLAGGSTDAAAVINGMNKLYDLNLGEKEIHNIAFEIGSDVPFCLKGGTAFATKRGEKLRYLRPLKKHKVLLVKPPEMVSTKKVYNLYDEYNISKDIPVKKLLDIINNNKELNIEDGWANVLELITKRLVPDVKIIKDKLLDQGFKFTMMTGSGPTVFSLLDKKDIDLAYNVINNWPRTDDFITLTETKNFN